MLQKQEKAFIQADRAIGIEQCYKTRQDNKTKTRWFILVAQERYKDSNIEFKIELRQGSCEKTSRSSSQATTLYVEETELVNDIEISIFK